MIVNAKSKLRHWAGVAGRRLPWLRAFGGRLGVGRWLAPSGTRDRVVLDGDVVIEFDLSVPIFRHIFFQHDLNQSAELRLMSRLADAETVFVDVGAHIGYVCLVAAKYARKVLAFEPSPTTFAMLQRNIQLNPALATKVLARQVGMGSSKGAFNLYTSPSHPGLASLSPIDAPDAVAQSVDIDTLDNVVDPSAGRVGMLKIDVEGAELDVLTGGAGLISRDRPLVAIELVEAHQRRFGRVCADILRFFGERDYVAVEVPDHLDPPRPFAPDALERDGAVNVLFVPRERVDAILAPGGRKNDG